MKEIVTMNKMYFSTVQVNGMVHDIIRQLVKDNFNPDYVVGITRGGLNPALMISHYLGIPLETLTVSLRDGCQSESNCWMSEDAYGYIDSPKNILIVDDINDTGATLNWIKDDWQGSCSPNKERWDYVWGKSTRFAVLVDNDASPFEVNYSATTINKAEDDVWIVYPWEEWWRSR